MYLYVSMLSCVGEHVYVWVLIHVQEGWMRTLGVLLQHSLFCDFKTMYLTVSGIRLKTSNSRGNPLPTSHSARMAVLYSHTLLLCVCWVFEFRTPCLHI